MPYKSEPQGVCKFCGADLVKNPHTGKIFCSKKCWLRSEKQSEASNPTSTLNPRYKAEFERTDDSRERLMKLEAQFNATFTKVNDNQFKIIAKIQDLEQKNAALWAVLIQGDKQKEESYNLHSIPILMKKDTEPNGDNQ
jgi:uncharacterized Zn finger protein (UPF0148 family)